METSHACCEYKKGGAQDEGAKQHLVCVISLHHLVEVLIRSFPIEEKAQECLKSTNSCVEEEEYEEFMVLKPDASSDPWTVMVHAHHAVAAYRTVVCPWWLDFLALLAVPVVH